MTPCKPMSPYRGHSSTMYYVNYTIGRDHYQAGPYSERDVLAHERDIAGYAHVTDVTVGTERIPERTLI